jgi:hypothetical protein
MRFTSSGVTNRVRRAAPRRAPRGSARCAPRVPAPSAIAAEAARLPHDAERVLVHALVDRELRGELLQPHQHRRLHDGLHLVDLEPVRDAAAGDLLEDLSSPS